MEGGWNFPFEEESFYMRLMFLNYLDNTKKGEREKGRNRANKGERERKRKKERESKRGIYIGRKRGGEKEGERLIERVREKGLEKKEKKRVFLPIFTFEVKVD